MLLGFAFLGPQWYWSWVGYRNHEHFYKGQPTSYWSAVIRKPSSSWAPFVPKSIHGLLGLGGFPAVLQRDPAAVPVLLDLVKDEDVEVRWDALLSLSETPNLPVGVPQAITPLLNDDNAEFRSFSAQRLATICSDETIIVPAILPLLKDEDRRVRRSIMSTLAGFGSKAKEVIPALCERLRDRSEHPSVRSSAGNALASMGSAAQPAVPVLREALQDAEGEVRVAAATALWRISGQAAPVLPILVQALKHPEVQIRHQAVESLGLMSPHVPGLVPAPRRSFGRPRLPSPISWRQLRCHGDGIRCCRKESHFRKGGKGCTNRRPISWGGER